MTRVGWLGPVVAGVTVAAGASALTAVLRDERWWWPGLLTIGVVVGVGLLARAYRAPWWAVPVGQLLAVGMTMTGLFSQRAVLGVVPGGEVLAELAGHLDAVAGQIGASVPPVATTTSLQVLICLVLGLMATVVDALTVAGYGPAACGLVLLCAYTVPATLAREALPDWTLVVGATAFGALLVVDHQRRRAGGDPISSPGTPTPDSATADGGTATVERLLARARAIAARIGSLPVALALIAASVVFALLVGVLMTPVGTEGRFGGGTPGDGGQDLRFGLNPFTSLRGSLQRAAPVELLRVRGLPEGTYLRALTLTDYVPSQGWQLPRRRLDTPLDRTLPTGVSTPVAGRTATVEVDNVGYRDRWLPLAGLPLGVTGVTPGRWRYDVRSTTAHTDGPVTERRWVQRAALPDPGPDVLDGLPYAIDVDPAYLSTAGVDPRIGRLAISLTSQARTPFAKVVVLTRYFLDPANGYRYSLRTAPGNTGDALLDFLLRGKTGYCEQFASALAVMLRSVGVPARVAVGFIPGRERDGVRSLGTGDAHAWVEVLFPGQGWLAFDPTPLGDGRAVSPSYLAQAPVVPVTPPPPALLTPPDPDPGRAPEAAGDSPAGQPPSGPGGPGEAPEGRAEPSGRPGGTESPSQPGGAEPPGRPGGAGPPAQPGGAGPPSQPGGAEPSGQPGGAGPPAQPGGAGPPGQPDGAGPPSAGSDPARTDPRPGAAPWAALLGMVVAFGGLALLAAPASARRLARRRRLGLAARGGAVGATAAWREVLAESRDRRGPPPGPGTVRATARQLVSAHRLDAEAAAAIRAVVSAVEHGWYAPVPDPGTGPGLVAALRAARSGFERVSPPRLGERLWPRSVRPRTGRAS